MPRTSRKRSTLANRAIVASAALLLGGGGLVAVNVYASAGEGDSNRSAPRSQNAGQSVSTIDCPDVATQDQLANVPDAARPEVDRNLALIDSQITEAYKRFADEKAQIERDPQFADNAILNPLKDKRAATLERIALSIGRVAERPQGLEGLAPCTLRAGNSPAEGGQGQNGGQNGGQGDGQNGGQDPGQNGGQGDGQNGGQDPGQDGGQGDGQNGGQDGGQDGGGQNGGGQAGNGPEASDFVDITTVQPNVKKARTARGGSKGTFTTDCGVNEAGKFNSDNVIVAPGVSNGAHHMHDYVGNQANDAFATDDSLAAAQTSCRNQGDKSTYYWPVLRLQNGQDEADANVDGGGKEGNVGEIQTPSQVTLTFAGSAKSKVTAMPRFLRIITGDAKAFTNGDANANASWSCTGFEDRQLKDKYPICPEGSQVVRSFKFQSCWDGQNADSANHRTHVAFADQNGRCQNGFKAIPQLQQRVVYDVPPGPGFALDSFPEQLHKPITDHGDFINVFDDNLMNKVVNCINGGRKCT
ncbi:DUF1996 domain-containing protein [Streptomyces scopuliridis]|uniref:DUF1996 domain-containing protein n=1 Tax=Streptomyces scopuliridis TaxID=452529 RepID=A0ACD4ZQL5_9ACTN|nr:DUF1996 domain-containing protein [Streptomyces scopuliridis]WSC00456.1 DUF1996 domain-containing protein [Streptomyces scopuliridis]WSC05932.1 DUF1996 domain-containing protein [Streptomyces scopuliridis]